MGLPALTTRRNVSLVRGSMVAALDIGSSKICCLIARHEGPHITDILGIGHQAAAGVKAGVIVDQRLAADAIAQAVSTAEEMAGETIEQVYVNAACVPVHSELRTASLALNGRAITPGDIQRLHSEARAAPLPQGYSLVHAMPFGFTLDSARGITDPRAMSGQKLTLDLHLLSLPTGPLQTLARTVSACHLDVAKLVATPYASALSCLVPDEMELGATLIDLGGGITTMAVFYEGRIIHADAIPVGGRHITSDIARGLTTPLADAERLKTLHGHSLPPSLADERELILIPQLGESAPQFANQAPRSQLIRIIRPRLEEIFEMTAARLAENPFAAMAGQNIVLVGGGALIPGCRELAQKVLQRHVRIGTPRSIPGLGGSDRGDFATAIGLLHAAVKDEAAVIPGMAAARMSLGDGWLGRMIGWFRQHV